MVNLFQSKKCSLRAILRNDGLRDAGDVITIIQKTVLKCDRIWTHGLLFIKAFLLKRFDEHVVPFPIVDAAFVFNAFRVLAGANVESGTPIAREQKQQLRNFYDAFYEATIPNAEPPMDMSYLGQILNYMSQEVVVIYENNVKQHWEKHLQLFVNDAHGKAEQCRAIDAGDGTVAVKKARKTALYRELEAIKTDIMNSRNPAPYQKRSPPGFHDWIYRAANQIMPVRNVVNNVHYDIAAKPSEYLRGMIFMGKGRERKAASTKVKIKLLSVFPLNTSLVPRSIRIDTVSLHDLLDDNRTLLAKQVGEWGDLQRALWNRFFRVDLPLFSGNQDPNKDGFRFNHTIVTDGISCTILLARISQLGKGRGKRGGGKAPQELGTPYLNTITQQKRHDLADKILIGIDPGLSDILYCVNGADHNEDQIKYRYTQNSRRNLLDIKKNQAQLREKKDTYLLDDLRSVNMWEADGITTNSKSCVFNDFLAYLGFKNRLNFTLRPFYQQTSFRRQRLNQYSKKQQCDMKLLKEFKHKFHEHAEPNDVVIGIGDWEQTIHRNHEPIKGKGMRAVFERAGYHVYLINEFRTSKMCSNCSQADGQLEKFRDVVNPRPHRHDIIKRHGLLRCRRCWTMWNRDVNAAVNMWKIAKAILAEQELPPDTLMHFKCPRYDDDELLLS